MHREKDKTNFSFEGDLEGLILNFEPSFLPGTTFKGVLLNGDSTPYHIKESTNTTILSTMLVLKGRIEFTVLHEGGISVLPMIQDPDEGAESTGIRIINALWKDHHYVIDVEGLAGRSYDLELFNNLGFPKRVEGAILIYNKNKLWLKTAFPGSCEEYCRKKITLSF